MSTLYPRLRIDTLLISDNSAKLSSRFDFSSDRILNDPSTQSNYRSAYYRGRTEYFSTKIGISFDPLIGCCSLCDELPNFKRSENDRQTLEQRSAQHWLIGKSVRPQRICSPRSGVKDFLLTNPDKVRDTKEKFGHRRCREDMWAKYINRSEELCKGLYIGGNPISWFPFGQKMMTAI